MSRLFGFSIISIGGLSGFGYLIFAMTGTDWALAASLNVPRILQACVFFLLAGLLLIAYRRGVETVRLREKIIEGQELELAFREQALDKHAMVVTTDPKGQILSVNRNFTEVLAYRPAEVEGKPLRSLLHKEQDAPIEDSLRRARAGDIWNGDVKVMNRKGAACIFHTTAIPMHDAFGRHLKTIYLATDMTEQRRSEREKQLTRCLELLPEDVLIFDAKTLRLSYMNGAAVKRHGWSEATYRRRKLTDILDNMTEADLVARTGALSHETQTTTRFEACSGGIPMDATVQIIEAEDRQQPCIVVLRDISDQKLAEESRKSFISMMTHELRTPLTSIKGAVQLLTAGTLGKLEPGVLSMLGIAEKNCERLLRLVNDILDLNKLEAGKMDMTIERIDTRDLVSEAILNDREYAAGLGVDFRYEAPEMPLLVDGDRGRLLQVLANLLSNAAKYSDEGATVDIGVSAIDNNICISVADTGPGIPEEAHATLFDSFTQSDLPAQGKINSTGLGLTIVRAILEIHDGTVHFDTKLGEGTTFYVMLPMAGEDELGGRSERRQAA